MGLKWLRCLWPLGLVLTLGGFFIFTMSPAQRLMRLERMNLEELDYRSQERAIDQAFHIAQGDRRPEIRRRVAQVILRSLSSGLEGRQFQAGHGNDEVLRELVRLRVRTNIVANTDFIWLAGDLRERSVMPVLRHFALRVSVRRVEEGSLVPIGWDSHPGWAANQALARMGDKAAIRLAIDCVQAAKPHRSQNWFALSSLDYIRQPATIKVFTDYLFENKGFERWPGRPEKNFVYGFLQESVEGWPYREPVERNLRTSKLRELGTGIEQARKWTRQQRTFHIRALPLHPRQ